MSTHYQINTLSGSSIQVNTDQEGVFRNTIKGLRGTGRAYRARVGTRVWNWGLNLLSNRIILTKGK